MERTNKIRKKYTNLAYNVYGFKKICEKCNSKNLICIHHKDENILNNSKENLQILCMSCHIKHHNKGNKNSLGYKHTKETKIKISETSKGKEYTRTFTGRFGELHPRSISVCQYSKKGKFIKTWGGIREAERKLGISHISLVCKGKGKTAGGFMWKYLKSNKM